MAIASWGIVTVSSNLGGRNKAIAKALEENTAVSETIRQRLEAIDGRLSAVERRSTTSPDKSLRPRVPAAGEYLFVIRAGRDMMGRFRHRQGDVP